MITAKEVRDLQRRSPFVPFTIHMTDGRAVKIERPEFMIAYKNFIVVAEPQGDELPEKSERLSVLHITRLSGQDVEIDS